VTLPLATISARLALATSTSFPKSLDKLDRLIGEGSTPVPVLTSVLATDPLLTAILLGDANATSSTDVTQLSTALIKLGLGAVHGHIRAAAHIPEGQRKELAAHWSLANACATMTRTLAIYCSITLSAKPDEETLQAAGLIHDIGSIMAILLFPDEYARACDRLDLGQGPLPHLLREELGVDTAALGTLVARHWRLPPLITACIRYHQDPQRADGFHEMVCLVHVARLLVRACGFTAGRDRFLEPINDEALRTLKLTLSDLERILDLFYDEMEELELYEGVFVKG
jgi:HD-like signal output (HDOD) protein